MSLTMRWSEADCLSRIVLTHAPRQATVSLTLGVRQKYQKMTPHQVSVAGEAYAACLFAQAGYDVLIQYGANQPGYDLVALVGDDSIRISVKATQLNGWGLIGSYKKGRTYHEAADEWFRAQDPSIVFAFVSFFNNAIGDLPRCYLATAKEVAEHHKTAFNGRGLTSGQRRLKLRSGDD